MRLIKHFRAVLPHTGLQNSVKQGSHINQHMCRDAPLTCPRMLPVDLVPGHAAAEASMDADAQHKTSLPNTLSTPDSHMQGP